MRNCKIHWKSKSDANITGGSATKFTEVKAKEIVRTFNKLWPNLIHWYEITSNSEKPD